MEYTEINHLEFSPIPNYPNYYINRHGIVITDGKRQRYTKGHIVDLEYKIRTISTVQTNYKDGNRGYAVVGIKKDNKWKFLKIHVLLATVFIPNPENKLTVNHIDGVKNNNSLNNLEWATHSENSKHALINGLRKTYMYKQPILDMDTGIIYEDINQLSKMKNIKIEALRKRLRFKDKYKTEFKYGNFIYIQP